MLMHKIDSSIAKNALTNAFIPVGGLNCRELLLVDVLCDVLLYYHIFLFVLALLDVLQNFSFITKDVFFVRYFVLSQGL
jgi:hypothetical protein